MRVLAAAVVAALLIPTVTAEFGHEANGFPVNADGETMFPYIPEDWAQRHPDLVQELLDPAGMSVTGEPLNKVNGYTLYPYYALLTAELQRLAEDHPDKVRLTSAGKSHLGLNLWLLEIADFANPDAVPLAEREVVYLDGGTHSNEYSGVYFVTEWAQFLLDEFETNETAKWIVENRHTWIMPMINVDGSHAFGRVNAIDVNVNRNFPSTWGAVDETPVVNWPGPYPASEPETQTVVKVLDQIKPDYVNSIHCCGNLWLHPYGAEHLGHAPDFDMFTNTCIEVFADLTVDVERIRCGETWSTIYPASGTTLDEGYGRNGASSWSYEMSGRGAVAPWGQPVINDDPREQEIESWRGVMHAFLHAERYGGLPVVTAIDVLEAGLDVTVHNQGLGNLSRATVMVAGHAVSIPDLAPGQAYQFSVPGAFSEGDVPVEMTWKKRLHPQSNWGEVSFDVPLANVDGTLMALLPELLTKPDMSYLLPEVAPELLPTMEAPQGKDIAQGASVQDASGFAVVLLIAALAIALVRRK